MTSHDPWSEPPAYSVDQRLRRALRVGPAPASDPGESDTWSAAALPAADFWGGAPRRARQLPSTARLRKLAAIGLVGGLAVAWTVTARAGKVSSSPRSETVGPNSVRPDAASPNAASPNSGGADADGRSSGRAPARVVAKAGPALLALVPAGARCGHPASAAEAHCSVAGVDVDYRLLAPDALRAAYLAPLVPGLTGGSMALGAGSGPSACALGGEEERSWSRPAAPKRAVGRYACRIEQGRAAMWWTVDARGLLAHAVSPGSDLTSLFAWWESHSER